MEGAEDVCIKHRPALASVEAFDYAVLSRVARLVAIILFLGVLNIQGILDQSYMSIHIPCLCLCLLPLHTAAI
jgi:hypothetical protein